MLSDADIEESLLRFERARSRYDRLGELVFERCRSLLHDELALRGDVQWRVKDARSLRAKLLKNRAQYADVDAVFALLSDLAGVRITTYRESDRDLAVQALQTCFAPPPAGHIFVDVKDQQGFAHHYRATHVQVSLPAALLRDAPDLAGLSCEIQVCSLLAHVFNEVEHDLQYKHLHGEISDVERRLLDELGQLTRQGDATVDALLQATLARQRAASGPFQDVHDFVARVRAHHPQARRFATHSAPLFEALQRLHVNTPQALSELSLDEGAHRQLWLDLTAYLAQQRAHVHLEVGTADELLVALLPRLADRLLPLTQPSRTHAKASRLHQLLRAYVDWRRRGVAGEGARAHIGV